MGRGTRTFSKIGRVCRLLLPAAALAFALPARARQEAAHAEKPVFWLIPHTHWEGAVFKTREQYLEMGLPNLLTAVRLLKEHPNYRFALDQVAYIRPFLERYPEEAAAFRRFVREGRLQIVGGMDVMPDDNMPGGETFVRQLLYAKGYVRDTLGVDVKVGWLLDTFGHHAQMPQIMKLAGFDSFWFFRGVEDRSKMQSELLWQGLDGTRIPAFWLPFAYGHLYGPPRDLPGFGKFVRQRWDALAPFSRGGDRVGLAGVDVSEPELYVAPLVDQLNRQGDQPFTLRIGVPTDFEKSVARREAQLLTPNAQRPTITGERNPLFQGIYSSRIELKQRLRQVEYLLGAAEQADVLASLTGSKPDDSDLSRAWEPVLFCQTHDQASGVMTDQVYEDALRSYDFSEKLGRELLESRLGRFTRRIETRGEGAPLVVYNTLGWSRTDVAEADIGFAAGGVKGFRVVGPRGETVPAQLLSADRYQDGGLKRIKIAFTVRAIPAAGYAVYHVLPEQTTDEHAPQQASADSLESDAYRLRLDPATGTVVGIDVKQGNWQALAGPGNVVAREVDNGDFWELYKNLDGFQNETMKRPMNVPSGEGVQLSNAEKAVKPATAIRGPVFSEYTVQHPLGKSGYTARIRVYNELPRIEFRTRILNNDRHVRYRVLFPTGLKSGKRTDSIPFGAIERPQAQEYPAQTWIDFGDGAHGVTLLNRGMPGNNVADGTLMLSLMRSTRIQYYQEDGSFERGMSSDSGLELGKELNFDYALLPHTGDWRRAQAYRAGMEFNCPLIVRKAEPHEGALGSNWGLIHVSSPNIVLSALMTASDGSIIVRLYEAAGTAASNVALMLNRRVAAANECDLMERAGKPLAVVGDAVRLTFHPFEIKTVKLHLVPQRTHSR